MNKTTINIIILTLAFAINSEIMAAVKIVECADSQGNTIFSKTCPAGYSVISEKKLSISKGSSGDEEGDINYDKVSATMYLIKEGCAACEDAKEYLTSLGVKVNAIYIEDDLEQQNKLKELAGELRVPFTIVGETSLKGYNQSKFEAAANEEASRKK
ncbi:MAG: glutaredoxin family protein [Proteobacteria bacterium]|nr:glutaredoxin family protein [Pseudomonadota bacterium]NOG61627.1 glutaredoxin family protein [Pseudomonadota bacterium]